MNDEYFMARALRLAEKGLYSTQPNPRVGCVLVKNGIEVATGFHLTDGEGHAEANALANLSMLGPLSGGDENSEITAYVTLEPCSFQGRTPSCAHSLVTAGVRRVVYAMTDPHPDNRGKGLSVLRDAGIQVDGPMMESSARLLNPGHIKKYEQGLPFVRLKLAMTMDGKTALNNGESQWITGPEARQDVQKLRARSSAVVTGVQTVIDDDPRLNVRASDLNIEFCDLSAAVARKVVVLDSKLRIPETAGLLGDPELIIACLESASNESTYLDATLWKTSPGKEGRVDLFSLLTQLAKAGCNEVLFECGATLAGSLIAEKLVDEIVIYMAPKLMGNEAKSLLNFASPDNMRDLAELEIKDVRQLGRDMRVTLMLKTEIEN